MPWANSRPEVSIPGCCRLDAGMFRRRACVKTFQVVGVATDVSIGDRERSRQRGASLHTDLPPHTPWANRRSCTVRPPLHTDLTPQTTRQIGTEKCLGTPPCALYAAETCTRDAVPAVKTHVKT